MLNNILKEKIELLEKDVALLKTENMKVEIEETKRSFQLTDTTQSIFLYNPLSFGKFQKTSNTRIRFPDISNNTTWCWWFNLKNESRPREAIHMKVEIKEPKRSFQLIDHPKKKVINSTQIITLALEAQNKPDNLFLEISHPDDLIRQRIPIEFKGYLTNSVCSILIILNAIFIILLIFLSFFFYYKCRWHCYKVRRNKGLELGSNYILIFPISGFVFIVVYTIKIFQTLLPISSIFVIIWSFITVGFGWFLIRFLCSEKDSARLDKKCNELH